MKSIFPFPGGLLLSLTLVVTAILGVVSVTSTTEQAAWAEKIGLKYPLLTDVRKKDCGSLWKRRS